MNTYHTATPAVMNKEEPLIRRLARSKAMSSRNASRDASMSPTRGGVSQPVQYVQYSPVQQFGEQFSSPQFEQQQQQQFQYPAPYSAPYYPSQYCLPYPAYHVYPPSVSHSLPSLQCSGPPATRPSAAVPPHRRLSRLSNISWACSVSQPDLSQAGGTTPTQTPPCSAPTSRASSPCPPSISARASHAPSPTLSPYGSQDILRLNSALSLLSSAQQQAGAGRRAGLSPQRGLPTKPCAVIAPQVVQQQPQLPGRVGRRASDQQGQQAGIGKLVPATTAGSCPDIPGCGAPDRRSVATSCSDLPSLPLTVVETCKICNLLHHGDHHHPQQDETGSQAGFYYSPCLYGSQVVAAQTAVARQEKNYPVQTVDKKRSGQERKR